MITCVPAQAEQYLQLLKFEGNKKAVKNIFSFWSWKEMISQVFVHNVVKEKETQLSLKFGRLQLKDMEIPHKRLICP